MKNQPTPNETTRLQLKQQLAGMLTAFTTVLGVAFYIELLGWRILTAELSLVDAWSPSFVLGALYTVAGAALLGLLLLAIGVIPRHTRNWSLSHAVMLWSVGAGMFLLAMLALVMWAP